MHIRVQDTIEQCMYKTLEDEKDLKRFENYLQDVIDKIHDIFPHTKKLVIRKCRSMHNDHEYYISVPSNTGEAYCVMSIQIAVSKGRWEEPADEKD